MHLPYNTFFTNPADSCSVVFDSAVNLVKLKWVRTLKALISSLEIKIHIGQVLHDKFLSTE